MSPEHGGTSHHEIQAGETASSAVVDVVSKTKGVEMTDIEPLTRTVDCDALDTLYETLDEEGSISFEYEGLDIILSGAGVISVTAADEDESTLGSA
jgi:hypothetical protein